MKYISSFRSTTYTIPKVQGLFHFKHIPYDLGGEYQGEGWEFHVRPSRINPVMMECEFRYDGRIEAIGEA